METIDIQLTKEFSRKTNHAGFPIFTNNSMRRNTPSLLTSAQLTGKPTSQLATLYYCMALKLSIYLVL